MIKKRCKVGFSPFLSSVVPFGVFAVTIFAIATTVTNEIPWEINFSPRSYTAIPL